MPEVNARRLRPRLKKCVLLGRPPSAHGERAITSVLLSHLAGQLSLFFGWACPAQSQREGYVDPAMRAASQSQERAKMAKGAEPLVARLPLQGSDAEILAALRGRLATGGAALFDRYHQHVRRILVRVLGAQSEINDLVQDVFVTAIDNIDRVADPESLRSWLTSIAVFTARKQIRRYARRRFFVLYPHEDFPEPEAPVSTPEIEEALRTTYRVLAKMPADERIAFTLRFVEEMELGEMAKACRVSLATIKRRLQRSKERFEKIASQYDELSEWLKGGP